MDGNGPDFREERTPGVSHRAQEHVKEVRHEITRQTIEAGIAGFLVSLESK